MYTYLACPASLWQCPAFLRVSKQLRNDRTYESGKTTTRLAQVKVVVALDFSSYSTPAADTIRVHHEFTIAHYKAIFTDGWKAIRDTLIIAGFAMPLGGLYGIVMGYLVARRQFVGRRTLEVASMINYALPGTIVGIAYLTAFNDPPLALTGTAFLIIACYVFRYGPTGVRATG